MTGGIRSIAHGSAGGTYPPRHREAGPIELATSQAQGGHSEGPAYRPPFGALQGFNFYAA